MDTTKIPKESEIVREICEFLNKEKYFFWRSNNIPVFGLSNDGNKRFRAMPKYSKKGIPDIIVIFAGRFIGFEVKRAGGRLRPEQEDFAVGCMKNGGVYHVVTNASSVQTIMAEQVRRAEFL